MASAWAAPKASGFSQKTATTAATRLFHQPAVLGRPATHVDAIAAVQHASLRPAEFCTPPIGKLLSSGLVRIADTSKGEFFARLPETIGMEVGDEPGA